MNKTLYLITTATLILTSCTSKAQPASAQDNAMINRIGQEAFQRGIGYGICNPDLDLNLIAISYTDGHNITILERDPGNPVRVIGRTMYIQAYGEENEDMQTDIANHETAHYCVTEEEYNPPIRIEDDLEVIGSNGFTLIVRRISTGEITDITELEEGRASLYTINTSKNKEETISGLRIRNNGYVETARLIDILSHNVNVSGVTMDFSQWYKAVTGKGINDGDLSRFIEISLDVFNGKLSPEDAVDQILN